MNAPKQDAVHQSVRTRMADLVRCCIKYLLMKILFAKRERGGCNYEKWN